jgi:hypothetical protein
MSDEEHVIDDDAQQNIDDRPARSPEAHEPLYEPGGDWLHDSEELPPRPRRRLLGAGGNPMALALIGVLLLACGFIGGVLVEKGETSSSSSSAGGASSFASRIAALRGGASSTSARSGAAAAATGGFASAGGGGGLTSGQVAYLAGNTLYVTDIEGNTIKVKTTPATSVTKTVKATVNAIHPGETVTVTGATGSNGAVSAESIRVGSSGSALGALFGGSGTRGSSGGGSTRGASGGGEPALFGG